MVAKSAYLSKLYILQLNHPAGTVGQLENKNIAKWDIFSGNGAIKSEFSMFYSGYNIDLKWCWFHGISSIFPMLDNIFFEMI